MPCWKNEPVTDAAVKVSVEIVQRSPFLLTLVKVSPLVGLLAQERLRVPLLLAHCTDAGSK
jgi:hypothetical protein